MAYIYLEELEKILPGILNQWIDEEDESWEWIFNEIEQKCHIGKKKKKKLVSMVDTHSTVLSAHRNDINELTKKVDELNNKISNLGERHTSLTLRVNDMSRNIAEAKSMAETAKQRTEVDYSKYSGKSDGKISYSGESKCCATCKYGGTGADVCIGCGYEHWEAKENE